MNAILNAIGIVCGLNGPLLKSESGRQRCNVGVEVWIEEKGTVLTRWEIELDSDSEDSMEQEMEVHQEARKKCFSTQPPNTTRRLEGWKASLRAPICQSGVV